MECLRRVRKGILWSNFNMRVLGIDPGSQYMGMGCVERKGNQLTYIGHELVVVKPKQDDSLSIRMQRIYASIHNAIQLWQPNAFAIESVFVSRNAMSALKLGQARGVAIAAAAMCGIHANEFSPREIKQTVTGNGAATKEQVEHMVRLLLGPSLTQGKLRHDVTDALAVAICHAQHRQSNDKFFSLERNYDRTSKRNSSTPRH